MARKRNSGSEKWLEVDALAGRRHGVVTRARLEGLGFTDAAIEHGVATGRLHPLFPAVFAVGHPRVGVHGRMLAAVFACGEGTVVSHGTAAALLGFWDYRPALIDVIAPGQSGRKIDGICRHHVPCPIPEEMDVRDGIPCTSPARTVVDLAGSIGERSLRSTVEKAAVLGMLDVAAIDSAMARGRRRGSPLLRAVLEDWRGLSGPIRLRSPLEARLLAMIAAHGLPTPLCNQRVTVGTGRRIEVDFLWEDRQVVVEADGRAFHGHPVAASRDYRRDRALARAGYRVQRVTWTQLEREPDETMAALRRILDP
jgi:very-short-patch-repair endonuclease